MVYVDDYFEKQDGRTRTCHLIADSTAELTTMARKIGVSPKRIQHAGTPAEHFDVNKERRERAVRLGAQPITLQQLGEKIRERRRT